MPSEINSSKIFFLISAIVNLLILLGWGGSSILGGSCLLSVGCPLGCFVGIFSLINLLSCIFDFIAYSKLNNLNQPGTAGTMKNAAVLEIITILTGNVVSLIFGILILQYLNNPNVDNYLKERNIY